MELLLPSVKYCVVLNFFPRLCRMLALLLQSEKEAFWSATVEPIFRLKEDLKIRLTEEQHQQLTAHHSTWEQVIQQVPWTDDIRGKKQRGFL